MGMVTWAPVSLLGLSSTGFMSCAGKPGRLGLHRLKGTTDLAALSGHRC